MYSTFQNFYFILHTGKKVRLQIRIDHKMFDMFTSRNANKIFKYPLSRRPRRPTTTTMSDQIVGLRECWLKFVGHFSGVSRTFWEEYVRPESMIVDTLGVYCITVKQIYCIKQNTVSILAINIHLFNFPLSTCSHMLQSYYLHMNEKR